MYGSHISVLVHCNGVYIKCNVVPNVFFLILYEPCKKYISQILYTSKTNDILT